MRSSLPFKSPQYLNVLNHKIRKEREYVVFASIKHHTRLHMILSDGEIIEYLNENKLIVTPMDETQLQPASIDIRLGNTFCILDCEENKPVKLGSRVNYKAFTQEKYELLPGQFVLASSMEYISLPTDLAAFVEGRSSLGRMGLFIQNAAWVEPGFSGEITLELFNASKYAIELQAGYKIGQLIFAKTQRNVLNPYSGKYQNQRGATGSREY